MQPRRRVKSRHHLRRLDAVEAAVAHQPPHHRTVLLLDECLIVLLVGARPRHFDLLRAAPGDDDVVHERAVVVEVSAENDPGEQALRSFNRLDDKAALARHQGQALRPARRHIHHRQSLNERPRDARATVSDHVDLAEARWRILPIVECADRDFAPNGGIEAHATALAACRRDLGVGQKSVDRCSANRQHQHTIGGTELQPPVPFQCRQQNRDHDLQPLAADPVRCLPQRRQRILDHNVVGRRALLSRLRCGRRPIGQRTHRVLAMPASHLAQLVENPPLLRPPRHSVAFGHC